MPNQSNDISHLLIRNKIMKGKNSKFKIVNTNIDKVKEFLKNSKDKKPPGVDGLDSRLLKLAADEIAPALVHIVNLSFTCGTCPQAWKQAKIIPLPKNKKLPFSGTNSRPISLLPVLGKMIETIVYEQVNNYLSINNIICNSQHAYRKAHSTATALTSMSDDWLREIAKKNRVGVVFLDFSAAFDIIDHHLLLEKLTCYGFEQSALNWFFSYLSNRTQTVLFNGSFSEIRTTTCGVPQGSCLGPLLFTIFTNDLPSVLDKANTVMYADDSTIYASALTNNELEIIINKELNGVAEWVKANKLVLNISKTNCMIVGSNHNIDNNPVLNIKIENITVNQVHETKLLGITVDNKLSWKKHISNMIAKMGRGISIIRRHATFMNQNILKIAIQSLILSHLDYCPAVWSNATGDMLNKLQCIQNRAARTILKCDNRTNIISMHKKLNWLLVKDRLLYSLIIVIRNVSVLKTPFDLFKNLSFSAENHKYSTRHASVGNFLLPKARSNAIRRTVLYRGMKEWNLLHKHIKLTTNINQFKLLFKQHLSK